MKKFVKVFFVTLGIIIFLVLTAVIIVPVAFKGTIMRVVKEQINKNLNAKVEFADFRLNLIRSFPNLNLSLDKLSVAGIGPFEEDTLVAFDRFSTSVSLAAYLRNQGIVIRSVLLDHPRVMARILETGEANWDIAKAVEEEVPEVDTMAAEMPALNIKLKKFEIRGGRIVYNDESANMQATLTGLDFLLSGNMNRDYTRLSLTTAIPALDVVYGGIKYLNQATVGFVANVGADMKNMAFTLEDNEFRLNDLALGFEGQVAIPSDDIDVDMTFNTKKTSFKSLLSLVPAIYKKEFESVQTDGLLTLSGYAKGIYSAADSTIPDVGIDLVVENARFQYPDLPKSVENVNINTKVLVNGSDPDLTTVDVTRFHLEIGGSPFDAALSIRTPISDPDVRGLMKGTIDLSAFSDIIPMEEVTLAGKVSTDLDVGGRLSMIEQGRYEDFKAGGRVELTAFEFNSPDVPQPVRIPTGTLEFSPRYVQVNQFDMTMGNSDMHFTGRLENFIPYVFRGETVKGSFLFTSGLLNITELIPEAAEETVDTVEDTLALALIEVPSNIDVELTSKLDKVIYNTIEVNNARGTITVRDSKVALKDMNMNALGGSIGILAEYNTQDKEKPTVSMNLDIAAVDIPSAYQSFMTVQKLVPLAQGLNGKVSTKLNYSSLIGQDFMPLISTINGAGELRSEEIQLVSSDVFEKIASTLKLRKDLTNTFKDIKSHFSISNGRIMVEPFTLNMGPVTMMIGGDQGIDQTMNYLLKMAIPRSAFGEGANEVVNGLAARAAAKGLKIQPGETVNVDVKISGTFTNPAIDLDLKESMQGAVQEIKDQMKEQVQQVVEEKKAEVTEKVVEEVDKLKTEADRRAQEIIDKATVIRDEALVRAREEKDKAYAGAAKIEADAKGNVAEQLKAKTKAAAIRKAADVAYNKAVDLANNEYQKALDLAEQERQKLK